MAALTQNRILKFGIFELDLNNRDLRRQGVQLKLQEQPYQILVALLERPGEIVARDEIRQRLWPTDTFVDFNNSVNAAVNRLRDTLGDSADNPRFIETVPRRGYRFIAPVEGSREIAVAPKTTSAAPGNGTQAHKRGRLWWWRTVGVAILFVMVAAPFVFRKHPHDKPFTPEIRSLVILPLENLSEDPSQEYFASGMTEELTTRLAQIPGLRVVSRISAQRYKGSKKSAAEIARELNVDAIFEGAVMVSKRRVRISAQLIHAAVDRHLWAQTYDRDLQDVLSLQEEISDTIAGQIRQKVEHTRINRAHAVVNPEAFDLYLQARYHSHRVTRSDTETAIWLLEKAVRLDPTFASGFSDLARAYRQKAVYFSDEPEPWLERAFVSVEKALSLDSDLADAHLARGFLLWSPYRHFDHEAAIKEYSRAIVLNPNLDEAHHQLGNVFMHIGLFDRALDELHQAVAQDPENAIAEFHLAVAEGYAGHYDEALKGFERTADFANPSLWTFEKSFALYRMNRRAEAASLASNYLSSQSKDEDGGLIASMNAVILAADDQAAAAQRSIDIARSAKPKLLIHFHHTAYNLAAAYALLGRREAVPWMKRAAADGFPCYPLFKSDRSFDRIRGDSDFKQLMTALRQEWEHYQQGT